MKKLLKLLPILMTDSFNGVISGIKGLSQHTAR